jgi:hypothetical protein
MIGGFAVVLVVAVVRVRSYRRAAECCRLAILSIAAGGTEEECMDLLPEDSYHN